MCSQKEVHARGDAPPDPIPVVKELLNACGKLI
jgi:hypothetical protein